MWEQIRDNQVRSVILVTFMGILLLLVGFAIGYYFLGDPILGLIIAALVVLHLVQPAAALGMRSSRPSSRARPRDGSA